MQDQDVKVSIGLFGSKEYQGGVYNVLSSFTNGLYHALNKLNPNSDFVSCLDAESQKPNLTLAFNASGVDNWHYSLDSGVPHVMWVVDSPFKHVSTISKFMKYSHFIVIAVSPVDKFPMQQYLPNIPFLYIPHAFDPKIWDCKDVEQDHDLVFMSSIIDIESEIEALKDSMDSMLFDLAIEIYDYALNNPEIAFWEIFKYFSASYDLELNDIGLYSSLFNNINYLVTYSRRVKMVQKLKNFNLKIWGSPQWEKYVEGNVQYMGSADLFESVDIVRKSKISLHLQPMQTLLGMHERVINAMAVKSFVVSDHNAQFDSYFGDLMAYYDNKSFEDLPDIINYYLKCSNDRKKKVEDAYENVHMNHTWDKRASLLLKKLTGQ